MALFLYPITKEKNKEVLAITKIMPSKEDIWGGLGDFGVS
jgi:hypothetical protein